MIPTFLRSIFVKPTKNNDTTNNTNNVNIADDSSTQSTSSQSLPNPNTFYTFGPVQTKFELVTNTWPWIEANTAAWNELISTKSSINAIVAGCSKAEELQNI